MPSPFNLIYLDDQVSQRFFSAAKTHRGILAFSESKEVLKKMGLKIEPNRYYNLIRKEQSQSLSPQENALKSILLIRIFDTLQDDFKDSHLLFNPESPQLLWQQNLDRKLNSQAQTCLRASRFVKRTSVTAAVPDSLRA